MSGRVTRQPRSSKVVRLCVSVPSRWLETINATVPPKRRSQFLCLAGFLAIADTAELRQTYRAALDVLLGRVRV